MTVVYDLLGAQNRDHGERGIARYVQHLALALEAIDPTFVTTYLVHDHLPVPGSLEGLIATGKTKLASELSRTPPLDGGIFLAGSAMEMAEPADRVLPTWARGPEWRLMAVLYDLIPQRFPEIYLRDPALARLVRARAEVLGSFDHLLAISEASANDATEILGTPADRITVIGAGADDRFRPPTTDRSDLVTELRDTPGLDRLESGFVLFPTGIEPRKNNDRLIKAYAVMAPTLRSKHQLVLVARLTPQDQKALESDAKELGIADNLLLTDFVSDSDLVKLNQAAELVVFPSIYEGFGLPVLEARRCGAATICADTSSLREVQPDSTARFDPYDTPSITAKLSETLSDPERIAELRQAPIPDFTWERAATETISAARRFWFSTTTPRPRLAIISPLPPAGSGIADYMAEALPHMAQSADITVYVEKSDPVEHIPAVRIRPIADFDRDEQNEGAYHRVLYQLGNSEYHVEAYRLLTRRGGDVELHDARLTGLFYQLQQAYPDELPNQKMGDLLMTWYPFRYRHQVEQMPSIWPETAARFGVLMARPVAHAADRIITHSRYAADLLHLDTGKTAAAIIPHPTLAPAGKVQLGMPDHAIISTFGIVAEVKQPSKLIEAMHTVAEAAPQAELRIVGSIDHVWQDRLSREAEDAGIGDRLTLTGRLEAADFNREIMEATVAVQLRAFSNGESSGAIARLLASGTPTIATAIGANHELPSPAVTLSPLDAPAADLGRQILSLLEPANYEAAQSSALEYAKANGFENYARQLLDALDLPSLT